MLCLLERKIEQNRLKSQQRELHKNEKDLIFKNKNYIRTKKNAF